MSHPSTSKRDGDSRSGGVAGAGKGTAERTDNSTPPPRQAQPLLIVGIGASAGGLEAFKGFFAQMPADSGMAFVLIQHLAPKHTSLLTELIARIDAAILDINLAGTSVFPAADALRERGIPFMFVSGYGAEGLPAEYRQRPVLQKPYGIEQLQQALTALLGAEVTTILPAPAA